MFHDSELTLVTANRSDFLIGMITVSLLVLFAAFLSSNTIWLICVSLCCIFFSYHCHRRLDQKVEAIGCEFKINSNGDILLDKRFAGAITGSLSGTQWCSRYLAVLRYKAAGSIGHLVIFKVRQRPEQFRQLSVWLRQNSRNKERHN